MKTTNLLIIGGAVVLGGLYLSNKSKKDKEDAQALADAKALADAQALALAQSQTPTVQPTEDLTGFYNTAQATKKALDVVTNWISLLDTIPKEALKEESNNAIRMRTYAEEAKKNKLAYDEALALAKSKNEPKFTFKDTTYWTANEQDVRNGSFTGSVWVRNPNNWYYDNQFNGENSKFQALAESMNVIRAGEQVADLGAWVKQAKQVKFAEIYDALKVSFTKIPKEEVNKLVILLPKYLFVANDDFKYFQDYLEKNPFTIEEQLYLKDINVEQLLSPPKKPINWTTLVGGLTMPNPAVEALAIR
jgi:hypothetical protein